MFLKKFGSAAAENTRRQRKAEEKAHCTEIAQAILDVTPFVDFLNSLRKHQTTQHGVRIIDYEYALPPFKNDRCFESLAWDDSDRVTLNIRQNGRRRLEGRSPVQSPSEMRVSVDKGLFDVTFYKPREGYAGNRINAEFIQERHTGIPALEFFEHLSNWLKNSASLWELDKGEAERITVYAPILSLLRARLSPSPAYPSGTFQRISLGLRKLVAGA